MKKVIVFGSLNMDLTIECAALPRPGQTIEGHGFLTNPGGKGGNQAVAAARMGAKTHMIARVGNDLFGEQLRGALQNSGVDCTYVSQSSRSGTGVAVITRCGRDNRIILSAGANHEIGADDAAGILNALGEPGDIFLTQYECDAQAVSFALAAARRQGMFTMFNPAPAKPIPAETYGNIDLIVVNQTECEFLTGLYPTGPDDCGDALLRFTALGAKGAVITLGEGGSVCCMGGETVFTESCCVPNVDTTAAGDAFIGALASGFVEGNPLSDCMALATRAAALTVTRQGAQQAIPTRSEVEAYFKEELQ